MKRWLAIIAYRSDDGIVEFSHEIEELEDIQNIVELGPHWDAVAKIEITRLRNARRTFTLSEGEAEGQARCQPSMA